MMKGQTLPCLLEAAGASINFTNLKLKYSLVRYKSVEWALLYAYMTQFSCAFCDFTIGCVYNKA